MKKTLPLFVAAGIIAFALSAFARPQEENAAAPDFSLTDLAGKPLRLADFKGKLLVLNFWATWCPPCRAEIPDFISMHKEYADRGLAIVGVSVDQLTPSRLKEWVTKAGINYPVALASEEIVADYRPGEYIPATILVDGGGRIRYRHVGVMDKATLVRLFKRFSN